MSVIDDLLREARSMKPENGKQWAYCDVNGKRLCVHIENYNGGDGQSRKVYKRTIWHYAGKQVKAADLVRVVGS